MKNRIIIFLALLLFFSSAYAADDLQIKAWKELYRRPEKLSVFPEHNKFTQEKYDLGKILFFDPRLSDSDIMGCHTCHNPSFHWTDGKPNPRGKDWLISHISKRTMTILNLNSNESQILWADDGAATLEDQPRIGMRAFDGMNLPVDKAAEKLRGVKGYHELFRKAFDTADATPEIKEGDFINGLTISMALATYQRTITSAKAPFDEWIEGKEDAISESAKRGFVIFNDKGNCSSCHQGWSFSGTGMKDIGVDRNFGSARPSAQIKMDLIYRQKIVGLRNIAERPPYFHNGMYSTLAEVIDFFDRGGNMKRETNELKPLGLTEQEKLDLEEFLKSLTSIDEPVTIPILPH